MDLEPDSLVCARVLPPERRFARILIVDDRGWVPARRMLPAPVLVRPASALLLTGDRGSSRFLALKGCLWKVAACGRSHAGSRAGGRGSIRAKLDGVGLATWMFE